MTTPKNVLRRRSIFWGHYRSDPCQYESYRKLNVAEFLFFRRPGCGSKCGIWGHIHGVLCPNHPKLLHPTHSSPQAHLPFTPLHLALLLFIHQSSDSSSTIRLNNLKVNGCHGPQGPPTKNNKTFARWRNRAMKPFFCRCTKRCDPSAWENAAQAVPVRLLVQEIACGVSSYVFFHLFNVFRSIL